MKYFFLLMMFILLSCTSSTNHNKAPQIPEVAKYIEKVMSIHDIPGIAVAILQNNEVIHKSLDGMASIENQSPVTDQTLWRIYSLTKLMVSTAIFQLIEEGKLPLTSTLSDHFDGLPLSWQNVEVRHLLSHSSGLPDIIPYAKELADDKLSGSDFIKLLYDDPMDFPTGTQWRYNQTNFLLIKEIIEKYCDCKFEDYILGRQFLSEQKPEALFSCDPDAQIPYRVSCYSYDHELEKIVKKSEHPGKKGYPLSGLHVTLDQMISWDQKLENEKLLYPETKKMMWQPFPYSESERHFLNGWDVYKVNGTDSYGFSGGGVCGYRKFIHNDLSIIVFTNGYKNYAVQDLIINHVVSLIDPSLADAKEFLTEEVMSDYFISGAHESIELSVQRSIDHYPGMHLEEVFKTIGYRMFFDMGQKEEAITLFQENVRLYPDSYDTHGSLAYLYFLTEQYAPAKQLYLKALEINPENSYSERTIKSIDEILAEK